MYTINDKQEPSATKFFCYEVNNMVTDPSEIRPATFQSLAQRANHYTWAKQYVY
jgi:hypothetical protein